MAFPPDSAPDSAVRHDKITNPTLDATFPLPSDPFCFVSIHSKFAFTSYQASVHENSGHVGGVRNRSDHRVIQHSCH